MSTGVYSGANRLPMTWHEPAAPGAADGAAAPAEVLSHDAHPLADAADDDVRQAGDGGDGGSEDEEEDREKSWR
jgi:hypothetical protein